MPEEIARPYRPEDEEVVALFMIDEHFVRETPMKRRSDVSLGMLIESSKEEWRDELLKVDYTGPEADILITFLERWIDGMCDFIAWEAREVAREELKKKHPQIVGINEEQKDVCIGMFYEHNPMELLFYACKWRTRHYPEAIGKIEIPSLARKVRHQHCCSKFPLAEQCREFREHPERYKFTSEERELLRIAGFADIDITRMEKPRAV